MTLILPWLKDNWRWFALAGCVVLGFLLVRQSGKLAACQAESSRQTANASQFQIITQTAQAKVIIRWRDKEMPCPDVEVSTSATEGQTQGQSVTITPAQVDSSWKFNALLGASWRPGSMILPADGLPAWGACVGAAYGPVWIMGDVPVEFSERGLRSANVAAGVSLSLR